MQGTGDAAGATLASPFAVDKVQGLDPGGGALYCIFAAASRPGASYPLLQTALREAASLGERCSVLVMDDLLAVVCWADSPLN